MYERLGEARLRSGERMEIGRVSAPDAAWRDRILPFLGHKPEPYASHIRRSYEGPLDGLETLFYVGHLDGKVISEVMISGARGAGILGHVFTHPDHRRKGAYQAVMAAQMEDMPHRGYSLLALGTGYDSPPYWIYHSFGFRGIGPGRGEMTWTSNSDAAADLFQPGPVTGREARWDDWGFFGWLGLLAPEAREELPRSRVMRVQGQGLVEGPYIHPMLAREQSPELIVHVLETGHGATVAWAILAPELIPGSPGGRPVSYDHCLTGAWTLDLHSHPHFAAALPELLAGITWPDAPVATAITEPAGPKASALQATEFARAAVLPGWYRTAHGDRHDMGLWIRR